jgi:uncharacterized membrane protein YhaH (DUF805 family)
MRWLSFFFSVKGRVTRSQAWSLMFAPYLILYLALFVYVQDQPDYGGVAMLLFLAIAFWPNIAVTAKRWHDRDKSAWWCLLMVVPVIGPIWTFVETGFLPGTTGPNRFGPDPLASTRKESMQ